MVLLFRRPIKRYIRMNPHPSQTEIVPCRIVRPEPPEPVGYLQGRAEAAAYEFCEGYAEKLADLTLVVDMFQVLKG